MFKWKQLSLLLANISESSLSRRMSTNSKKALLAVCQMTSTEDKHANFEVAKSLIERASAQGCHMIFLPECFDMICDSRKKTIANAETIDGNIVTQYKQLAKSKGVWLSLGGLHERNEGTEESGKVYNAHIVINNEGEIASVYRKTHLFNLDIPGVVRLVESEFSIAGDKIIPPVQTPVGKVGLGICYDVRFAEFAIALAKSDADIITYPSSFTVTTGLAHWHSLMRARAIETQCYVVSAAQVGTHNAKRSSFGHALVVDPWGCVIAECSDKAGFAVAEIDFDFIKQVRMKLPVWSDRRPQLYGEIIPAGNVSKIEDNETYQFGQSFTIPASQVFYRSRYSYAFVNHRPVLPGHVLISPLRYAKRFTDLSPCEVSDLFCTAQCVERAIEQEYQASSSTIAIQDGPDAGQSIDHLHVHVLPRKSTDFGGRVDQIYAELQMHDKVDQINKKPIRSEEDMAKEALKLRSYFNHI